MTLKFKVGEEILLNMTINMTINMISNLFIFIIATLDKLNNLPNIIQGIGIGLLTILIPLAIAILIDVYQKRRGEEIEFINLDLHVILDNVFKIKLLILSVSLIFLPMLFWEILTGPVRLIGIILTSFGILIIIRIITNVYCWIKGNFLEYRFSYLKKLKKINDLETVWRSTWEAKNINFQNEKEFFMIFSSKIDKLLKSNKKSLKAISKLLNDFNNSANNREVFFLSCAKEVFPKILEWHFKIWQNKFIYIKKTLEGKDELKNSSIYIEISRVLDAILSNIEERSFKEAEAFSFFIHFKKHAEKYKDELVGNGKKDFYINYLFDLFYKVFFKYMEKTNFSQNDFIWEQCFPKEWKVSKTNLVDKEKKHLSNLSLICFVNWAQKRINWATEKKDFILGKVASNLIPKVDSNLIIKLLVFINSGPKKKNGVKLAIEKPWDFGFTTRFKQYPSDTDKEETEDIENEKQRTFELACLLFKKELSGENLIQYIKEINDLKYLEGSNEENEKIELLDIFNGMLEYLNK